MSKFPRNKGDERRRVDNTTVIRTTYGINVSDSWRAEDIYENYDQIEMIEEQIWEKGVIADEVRKPARKIMFIDGMDVVAASEMGNYIEHWDEHGEIPWQYTIDTGEFHWCEPVYRHNEGANVIMCDGHAEYRKKTELFYFLDDNKPNAAGTNIDWIKNDRIWCFFK